MEPVTSSYIRGRNTKEIQKDATAGPIKGPEKEEKTHMCRMNESAEMEQQLLELLLH